MFEESIYELKSRKLMAEFHDLKDELLKRESYLIGLEKAISIQVKYFYSKYVGRWYNMAFASYTVDDAEVRIGNIEVSFCCSNAGIQVDLVVNPDDIKKNAKMTEKEKQLLAKAKKLWKEDAEDNGMYLFDEMKSISDQLGMLKNGYELVNSLYFYFDEKEVMERSTFCISQLNLGKFGGETVYLDKFIVLK